MITLPQARELLKQAVATQGRDFIYKRPGDIEPQESCSYLPHPKRDHTDDRPCTKTGCLIGVALELAGETRQHEPIHHARAFASLASLVDMATVSAINYFCAAQTAQDGGFSWGVAYDNAELLAERMTPEQRREGCPHPVHGERGVTF